MTRARIRKTPHKSVTYHLPEGHHLNLSFGPANREFFVPQDGGWVREYRQNHQFSQVCERLERYGNTLSANSTEELLPLVRTEHRRALSHKRRQDSLYSSA